LWAAQGGIRVHRGLLILKQEKLHFTNRKQYVLNQTGKQSTAEDNFRNIVVARFHVFMPITILLALALNFQ
jgi:hypothetical protein